MMADYWVYRRHEMGPAMMSGPHHNRDDAIQVVAERAMGTEMKGYDPNFTGKVLLDLSSVNMSDDHELEELLHHDPLLRAFFEMGKRVQAMSNGHVDG